MEKIRLFLEDYSYLLESDFNRGYLCGVALILLIVLLAMVIKIWWSLVFRTRKCKSIIVPISDGDIMVSLGAVTDTVRTALTAFPLLLISDVRLYRSGCKGYFIELRGGLDVSGQESLPEILPQIKQHIFDALKSTFGITCVKKIRVRLDKVAGNKTAVIGQPTQPEESTVSE